jgi:hypothetical membrane protein
LFFKAALVLLASWFLGLLGVYDLGRLVHVLLLIGLLFLLLAATKARDAAANRGIRPNSDGS